ncbi:MAG TPA: aldehyde ferredoxin oxidoreductase N-terminal domain-containing protein [Thermodesulfobacteriota bacterium]|nr:aldehyde ferredoxin oxidoreductase N-terminal domain-containing protein [Thermodesulfobacteriota bacterium]
MEYLSTNKIAIVDLTNSKVSDQELDEDLVKEKIGGAGITRALYEQYQNEDPIILGTGLLTGTLAPASALGMITAKSPLTGKVCHAPFTLYAGLELKYSGFDYVVIKGKSPKPVYLWMHDGVADIGDAKDVWGKDVWASTDTMRELMGDQLIQILTIGKAGESESDFAQICINYWASGDSWGFGKLFGQKKLKLVALRGMSLLELSDAEGFVQQCKELLSALKAGASAEKRGIAEIPVPTGEEDIRKWLAPLVHRHQSCFNTPFPTNTFVFLDEDPGLLKESEKNEPGFLLTDLYGLLGFKKIGLSPADACALLRECAKYGIDAVAVAELSQKAGKKKTDEIKKSFSGLKGSLENIGKGTFSPWCPNFGLPANQWERRQAVAYIFGIHPIYAMVAPELSEEKLIELANIGTGLGFTSETLEKVIADISK